MKRGVEGERNSGPVGLCNGFSWMGGGEGAGYDRSTVLESWATCGVLQNQG